MTTNRQLQGGRKRETAALQWQWSKPHIIKTQYVCFSETSSTLTLWVLGSSQLRLTLWVLGSSQLLLTLWVQGSSQLLLTLWELERTVCTGWAEPSTVSHG